MNRVLFFLVLLATLSLVACSALTSNPPAPAYFPTQAWSAAAPEEQGLDSAKLAAGLRAIRVKNIPIHSLLVIRNGKVLMDASFYPYDGKDVHRVASVTKSIMTTLIAIAAEQGKLKLDAPVLSFFPDRTIANRDARKERLTVRHLAGMANGMDSVCLKNDEGTLTEMMASPDWVQFALDRKMTSEPGTTFCYDTPGMHLLSAILQQATGMTALEFARQNLFEPLGIHDVLWMTDPQGYSHGGSDVYLFPRDAAKLGYLWLNKGMWDGKQIVSRQWVEEAVKARSKTGSDDDYGYGWWVMTGDGAGQYAALGRGGQRVQVAPALNAIIVMTGAGVEFDDVAPYLTAALVNPTGALPANSNAVAELDAALEEIAQPPAAKPIAPLPSVARSISGKTFTFEPNPVQLKTLRIDFDAPDAAKLRLTFADNQPPRDGIVGLDGVYRFTAGRNNLPVGARGTWTDDNTFALEYDEIANGESYALRAQYTSDRLVLTMKERAHDAMLTLNGKMNSDPQESSIPLQPCRLGNTAAQCGTLSVFEDRAAQSGRKINVRMAVIKAVSTRPAPDPIFWLAGGPGGAATEDAPYALQFLMLAHQQRDLVFVDQRGTGGSNKQSCPQTTDGAGAVEDVRACLPKLNGDPRAYTTAWAMDDVDEVRAALGYDRINLYGESYGATAEQVYLLRHGEHVRTATLVAGSLLDTPMFERYPISSQQALEKLFVRCQADAACALAYPNLRQEFDGALARLNRAPITLPINDPSTAEPVVLTPQLFKTTIHGALLRVPTVALVPRFIHLVFREDWNALAALIAPFLNPEGAKPEWNMMNLTILCHEDWAKIRAAETTAASDGSYLGYADVRALTVPEEMCAVMPRPKPEALYGAVTDSAVPVLLINGEADPQDPPENVAGARQRYPNSLTLVAPGQPHGYSGVPCRAYLVADFIARGSVDGLSAKCLQEVALPSFAE